MASTRLNVAARLSVLSVLAVLACSLVGCSGGDGKGSSSSTGATFTVTGQIQVPYSTFMIHDGQQSMAYSDGSGGVTYKTPATGLSCSAVGLNGANSDLAQGASVTVTDAAGVTVGLGTLSAGSLAPMAGVTGLWNCALTFQVKGVPAGRQFYGVAVASRPPTKYAEADLAKPIALQFY